VLGLVGSILLLPVLFGLVAAGYDFEAAAAGRPQAMPAGPLALITEVYAFVFALLGLVVLARLSPLYATIVVERRAAGAIGRAYGLTRGHTWKLVGALLLYFIVSTVSVLAAQSVFGLVFRLVDPLSGPFGFAAIATAIVAAAVQTIFAVLALVFCAELYRAATAPTMRAT